jgi:putative oxidoreductase
VESRRIATALLVLRLTIFFVMLILTIDKFVRPPHAASVYEHFCFLGGFSPTIIYALGDPELLLLIGLSSASRRG